VTELKVKLMADLDADDASLARPVQSLSKES
jgi:hypothetical protein